MSETINHPAHYGGDVAHETWKCLNAWGLEQDALLWNAVKYISRAGKKGDKLEDLKKAQWYLNKRIELLETGTTQDWDDSDRLMAKIPHLRKSYSNTKR